MKLQGDWGGFVASSRALLRLCATQAKNRCELFARPRVTVNLELSKLFSLTRKHQGVFKFVKKHCYLFGASAHLNRFFETSSSARATASNQTMQNIVMATHQESIMSLVTLNKSLRISPETSFRLISSV